MPAKNLRSQVSELLVEDGFQRHGRMHLLRVDEQVSYWVDTGPLGQRSDIAPHAGIRHDEIEFLRSRFFNQQPDDVRGTVGANIGYIKSGEYCSWEPPYNPSEVLAEIQAALEFLDRFYLRDGS